MEVVKTFEDLSQDGGNVDLIDDTSLHLWGREYTPINAETEYIVTSHTHTHILALFPSLMRERKKLGIFRHVRNITGRENIIGCGRSLYSC